MFIKAADQVAVMPRNAKSPADVLRISKVQFAGQFCIQTKDGHIYAATDGEDFASQSRYYIEPATGEHHAAILRRASHISPDFRVAQACHSLPARQPRAFAMSSPLPKLSLWSPSS